MVISEGVGLYARAKPFVPTVRDDRVSVALCIKRYGLIEQPCRMPTESTKNSNLTVLSHSGGYYNTEEIFINRTSAA